MSYDLNACCFSGKVEKFRRIDTRTGTPMLAFTLKCWKELIRVVAFKEVAEDATFNDGDRIELSGRLQTSSWTHEGTKYFGFQIVMDKFQVEIQGDDQEMEQPTRPPARTKKNRAPSIQQDDENYREPVYCDSVPF